MTTICLLFFAPLPTPVPIPLWSPPLCMARSALMLKDDLVGCPPNGRSRTCDIIDFHTSAPALFRMFSLTVSCRGFGERWRSETGKLTRLSACLSPIRGCLFSGVSLSLCFRAPADLPHGLPEWATCWNTRSADLHLPGLVETAWYEWNSLAQDILLRNMSTWIHFPAQKGSSAALPHSWGTGMQGGDDSLRLCAFVPWLIGSSSSLFVARKKKGVLQTVRSWHLISKHRRRLVLSLLRPRHDSNEDQHKRQRRNVGFYCRGLSAVTFN